MIKVLFQFQDSVSLKISPKLTEAAIVHKNLIRLLSRNFMKISQQK